MKYSTRAALQTELARILDPNTLASNKLQPGGHLGMLTHISDTMALKDEIPSGQLQAATATISSADILAGNTVEIVQAPGVGYIHLIHTMYFQLLWESGNTAYNSVTSPLVVKPQNVSSSFSSLITQTEKYYLIHQYGATYGPMLNSENIAILLDFNNGFTQGNSDIFVKVWYTTEAVDPTA